MLLGASAWRGGDGAVGVQVGIPGEGGDGVRGAGGRASDGCGDGGEGW